MKRVLPCLLALAALTGCGSSRNGVEAAVRRSPLTYFHYAAVRWWGHPVTVRVNHVRTSGAWAGAVVSVRRGHRLVAQEVVLVRHAGRWRVVAASDVDERLSCELAPTGVVRRVVGTCLDEVSAVARVSAPRRSRAPTAQERAAIVALARSEIFHGRDRCVRYRIRVSRLDGRFALVSYGFVRPYRDCLLGNGESLFEKRPNGDWLHLVDGSEPFFCGTAPPGVIASLSGICEIEGTPADLRAQLRYLRRVRAAP